MLANHLSLVDPPLIGVILGRKAKFMSKKELFQSRLSSYILSKLYAFPVRREQLDRQALRQAEKTLADGLALIMFPEATRSKNAQLQPAFSGSTLIASRNSVPILPVGITGTEKIRSITGVLHRPRLTINFGSTFRLPPANGKLTKKTLDEFTNLIMNHIAELLPVEYRGNYTGKET